jgi:hypothetical protein
MNMETSKAAQTGLYDTKPAPAIERIAGIEGQSNFLSLLAGIEAGPDTTQIMGALAFTRGEGAIPEVLEAHFAKSVLYKLPLMSMVFMVLVREYGPEEEEWPWIQGAIADAFMLLRDGKCKPLHVRARQFRVGHEAYGAIRKAADIILADLLSTARASYNRARRSGGDSPGFRQAVGEDGDKNSFGMAPGCYFATPLSGGEDGEPSGFDTRGLGVLDNTGYYWPNDRPSPVLTLYGEEAEAHCRLHPAHSKLPYSL